MGLGKWLCPETVLAVFQGCWGLEWLGYIMKLLRVFSAACGALSPLRKAKMNVRGSRFVACAEGFRSQPRDLDPLTNLSCSPCWLEAHSIIAPLGLNFHGCFFLTRRCRGAYRPQAYLNQRQHPSEPMRKVKERRMWCLHLAVPPGPEAPV